MDLNFDARQHNPEQGMGKHPTGKFPAIISDVSVEENNNKDGGYFSVKFTTPSGQIAKNYNLWFTNPNEGQQKAQEIARNNLSALCHAVGIYLLPTGKELINARCQIEVAPQAKNDKYNEVSKVYDANGNEPGKAPTAPQPASGGWSQTATQQAPAAPGGWSAPAAPASPPPAAAPVNTWQPGPSAAPGERPPWAK